MRNEEKKQLKLFDVDPDGFTPEQLNKIKTLIQEEVRDMVFDVLKVNVLSVEPIRPRDGMMAYADGVFWDPASDGSSGIFAYQSGTWTKLF